MREVRNNSDRDNSEECERNLVNETYVGGETCHSRTI